MRIMKNILLILLLVLALESNAQQDAYFSNYTENLYLINPAYAGSTNHTELRLHITSYFMGFTDNNPGTQLLSLSSAYENYGLGLIVSNDKFGNSRKTGIGLTYSYHLQAGEAGRLAFGLRPRFYQYSMHQDNYVFFDENDQALALSRESKVVFDADFGMYFYHQTYFASFSVLNLLQPNISVGGNESDENRVMRSFMLNGGYRFEPDSRISVEPSMMICFNGIGITADINAQVRFNRTFGAGISYKTRNAIGMMVGVRYNNIHFAYAFDYSLGALHQFSSGTHEIMLGLDFGSIKSEAKL